MKKIFMKLFLSFIFVFVFAATVSADSGIKVYIDGKELVSDTPAQIMNGRTMVPMRTVFEALGADVDWNEQERTVTATKDSTSIKLTIGANVFYKNNDSISLDAPAAIVEGRTMVPARAVSESLDCEVKWDPSAKTVTITTPDQSENISPNVEVVSNNDTLKVTYFDVGQGDSILVTSPDGKNMLIDAGEGEGYKGSVIKYLKERNISKLDTVVATHPHSDHISAMDDVLNTISVDKFYLPKVSHTTKDFENMVSAATNANEVIEAKSGMDFDFGSYIDCKILAPVSDSYDDLNNYSAAIKLVYGSTSFLFMGDAEELSEKEILESKADVAADVLKCGHHGSSTSTSDDFLNSVDPDYAVISCGKDNQYGHPHKETIQKLAKNNVTVLRTDESGTITITSDGENISTNAVSAPKTEKTSEKTETNISKDDENEIVNTEKATNDNSEKLYIGNINTKVYHSQDCGSLPMEKNRVYLTESQAVNEGYRPHKNCVK